MKKWISIFALVVLLSGCQLTEQPEAASVPEQDDTIKSEQKSGSVVKSPVIQDERAVLEAFDALAQDNVDPAALNAFLTDHISNLGVDSANVALVTYLDEVMEYAGRMDGSLLSPRYQNLSRQNLGDVFDSDRLASLPQGKFKDLVETLYNNGLTIERSGNIYVSVVDFERMLRNYGNEVGEDVNSYIRLNQALLKQRITVDSKTAMNDVARLIVDHDKYLKAYPNSMVFAKVVQQRDWLRRVYFVKSYEENRNEYGQIEPFVAESFREIAEFYPGTALSVMSGDVQTFLERNQNVSVAALEYYVGYYDESVRTSGGSLREEVLDTGVKYPVMTGSRVDEAFRETITAMAGSLGRRYGTESIEGWSLSQDYDIAFSDDDKISVVFHSDLFNPRFPGLAVRDVSAHTISLDTGRVMTLRELIPGEKDSWSVKINVLRDYAEGQGFDMSGISDLWTDCYLSKEGLVLYRSGLQTGHSMQLLLVPNDLIENWLQ